MATINPYLTFMGNTEEAFNFYKSVFGVEFVDLTRFKDIPDGDKMSADDQGKIMHVALPISNGNILMGSDALESMGHSQILGNHISISIGTESKDEATHLFNGLSAGGEIEMPIADTFWGAYFGMFIDKFGIKWMVNYDYPKS